jgi:AcrR family transcriptional regulator
VTKQRIVRVAARMVKRRGLSAFSMRGLARELECQPAALYHYVRSREYLLEAVAGLAERKLTRAMFTAATGIVDERAQKRVRQAVDAFLRFASEEPNSWELLFLHPATASAGRRVRLTLGRRLASLMAECGESTDENRANAAASAKLTMTVAIGEAAVRVCRPGLTGCELSPEQIVDLFLQRTQEG